MNVIEDMEKDIWTSLISHFLKLKSFKTYSKIVGLKIKMLRETKNLSEDDFSNKVNLSKELLMDYENGKKMPSEIEMFRIAKTFQIRLEYLIDPEDNADIHITVKPNLRISNIEYEFISFFRELSISEKEQLLNELRHSFLESKNNNIVS